MILNIFMEGCIAVECRGLSILSKCLILTITQSSAQEYI